MTSSISSAWSSAAWRADLGVGAGAEAAGQLAADVELDVGVAHQQGLGVGVDRDELDALESDLDHPVDGVDATATDAHDLDDGQVVLGCCHGVCLSMCGPAGAGRRVDVGVAVGSPLGADRNSNPEPEGYSYVNLAMRTTLGSRVAAIRGDTRSGRGEFLPIASGRDRSGPGGRLRRGR